MIFLVLWILFSQRISLIGAIGDCCMEGAPIMGRNIRFQGILQRKFPHIHIKHCIIHWEALASKELSSMSNEVMQLVIKMVNFVKSRYLNCRLFKDHCSTENAVHSTLLLCTAVGGFRAVAH